VEAIHAIIKLFYCFIEGINTYNVLIIISSIAASTSELATSSESRLANKLLENYNKQVTHVDICVKLWGFQAEAQPGFC